MSSILHVATSVPKHCYTTADLISVGSRWLGADPERRELFERVLRSSKTEVRHFVEDADVLLSLEGSARRAELFELHGTMLGEQSQRSALSGSGVSAHEIGTLVFTSCSCPVIPSIDGSLVQRVGLAPTVNRVPMYQQGCAGGVVGLALANRLSSLGKPVLLTSVELCSLVFYPNDHSGAHLVGSALFADGSATAVISPEDDGLVFIGAQSYLIPDTRHLMGYDVLDDGSHLRLDRDLPSKLVAVVPELVSSFLAQFRLTAEQIPWWLFHPGGVKILNFLDQTFGLSWEQSRWARETLSQYGNLSSSSVLFVLKRFLEQGNYRAGDYVLMVGVGPGLTIELILFQASSSSSAAAAAGR